MSVEEGKYITLYGTMVTGDKIVGFCRKHRVHLTEAQLKKKECVPKNCRALKKWDCPFWDERERIRKIKQMKKEAGIPSWEKVEIRTDHNGELLPPKLKEKR